MMVKMYSTRWCGDCRRAQRFLDSYGIEYEVIDVDRDQDAAALVMQHNHGRRRVPTFSIGNHFYGNPPLIELGRLLGIDQ